MDYKIDQYKIIFYTYSYFLEKLWEAFKLSFYEVVDYIY